MLSIPELATQMVDNSLSGNYNVNSKTLFFVGNVSVGKTTLLNTLLDKNEATRETLVLEYSFGRKSNQKSDGYEKTICHIWEYGGKLDILKNILLSIPLRGKCYYCVMIDLSKIKTIWITLETCIQSIKNNFESKSFPEIVIIGGKYDLFKNYDADVRKYTCSTLRSVAILMSSHLIFYSSKDSHLSRRMKDSLLSMGFGAGFPDKEKCVNYMKPLYIPRGTDSWESIGISVSTFEEVKARHFSRIPDSAVTQNDGVVEPHQAYPEMNLDSIISAKYNELKNLETVDVFLIDYLIDLRNTL